MTAALSWGGASHMTNRHHLSGDLLICKAVTGVCVPSHVITHQGHIFVIFSPFGRIF